MSSRKTDYSAEAWERLRADGWRQGPRDGLWRNDRFGGSYKTENALRRIGSKRGEETAVEGGVR